ncbi:hypothetical protein [Sphingomonas crocodyli]|uniref:Uncharacterized protein n=1 Tax=Sphingomonas crocodyli TaxID=1979270 RepID=A0A437MAA5_9SPHN|nr:hypothetical protein [Sphingomonas crocodyli]RVT94564.1 hypothetical protein EOD43_12215 [Sphingomonas crocodyli]
MDDLNLPLIIAAVTALVGLLCLGLAFAAYGRARKAARAPAGAVLGEGEETPAQLRAFGARNLLSAAVMFALAVVIILFS